MEVAARSGIPTPQSSPKDVADPFDFLPDAPVLRESLLTIDDGNRDIPSSTVESDTMSNNLQGYGERRRNTTGQQLASWRQPSQTVSQESNATATQISIPISQVTPGPAYPSEAQLEVAYGYGIQREDGTYTRLLRADEIPPVFNVAQAQGPEGLIVLPALRNAAPVPGLPSNIITNRSVISALPALPQVASEMQRGDSTQLAIDHIVDRNIGMTANTFTLPQAHVQRKKIYCDKWIHEGICAFTQVGCKYKHEMPTDRETQRSLGLNNGYPGWYVRMQTETNAAKDNHRASNAGYNSSVGYANTSYGNASHGAIGGHVGCGGAAHSSRELIWRRGEGDVSPRKGFRQGLFARPEHKNVSSYAMLQQLEDARSMSTDSDEHLEFKGRGNRA